MDFELIGITGLKRSGKDTIGNYLVEKHNYIRLGFADNLKQACKIIFGFDEKQLYGNTKETVDEYWEHSPREILQTVGTDLFRNEFGKYLKNMKPNIWMKSLEKKINNIVQEYKENKLGKPKIVITDVRFENELEFIRNYNGKIIKVVRDSIELNQYSLHESETFIQKLKTDFTINNNSTLQNLYNHVEKLELY
jgi:hypothetical protein